MTEGNGSGNRPTILQVLPSLETGGAEQTAVDVAAAIVAAGGRAVVASTGGRMVAALEKAGAKHVLFPAASKNPATMIANIGRLARLARAEGADIIHARSRAPAWSSLFAARRTGLPFVTTFHGAYKEAGFLKGLYNSVMARGDRVIANSDWTAREIVARHPAAAGRIVTIPRGSDLAALAPGAVAARRLELVKQAWGLSPDERVVLVMARLTSWKGHHTVIEAMRVLQDAIAGDPSLAARLGNVVAIFAGDAQGRDGYRSELLAQISADRLEGRVRLVGHCSDVPAAMTLADVVVVASVKPEAFGRAAVEAQAAGRPVIATDLGAAAETVLVPPAVAETGRTGWRVPPGDAEALAAALAGVLSLTPGERVQLAGRAIAHVNAEFSLAQMTHKTLAVYDDLLQDRGKSFGIVQSPEDEGPKGAKR